MEQRLLRKVSILLAVGLMIHQKEIELQSLQNTKTIDGTMLAISSNQDMLMLRSHMVYSRWLLVVPRQIQNREYDILDYTVKTK